VDGYTLDLTFKTWNLNPDLEDTAFVLTAPEGAERMELKEKGRSQ
jgi:outer membrane lipoprotein-sorting protein